MKPPLRKKWPDRQAEPRFVPVGHSGNKYSLGHIGTSEISPRRVAAASNIVQVIGAYFPLRRAGANFKALCPFHQEKTPSFMVSASRQIFHCFGCGAGGGIFRFVMDYEHVDFATAVRKLAVRAGMTALNAVSPPAVLRPQAPRPDDSEPPCPLRLDFLQHGSAHDLKRLAALRGFARESLEIASSVGVLRFARLKSCRAWVVTDMAHCVAEARRLDGQAWQHIGGAKSWTLPGGNKKWPLGIFEAQKCRAIALVEGAPDFLAAFHWIWAEDRRDVAPVAILGASLSIHRAALPLFAKKRVRIFPHCDAERFNGFDAARRWEAQLQSVIVDCFDCSGLIRNDGHAVSDLNDLCSAGPEIRELMP